MIIEEIKVCNACNKKTTAYVTLICPNCGKELIRCDECRRNKTELVCSCGFVLP